MIVDLADAVYLVVDVVVVDLFVQLLDADLLRFLLFLRV